MSQCGSQRFVQFNVRIISAQHSSRARRLALFGMQPLSTAHCPLLFVGGRAQLAAIGGTVMRGLAARAAHLRETDCVAGHVRFEVRRETGKE